MNRYPIQLAQRFLRVLEDEVLEPVERNTTSNSFMSFRYSHTEISAFGDKAHVKSKSTRFENGKLTSDEFEGELPRAAYDRMLDQARQNFTAQMNGLVKSLTPFLPFTVRERDDRER